MNFGNRQYWLSGEIMQALISSIFSPPPPFQMSQQPPDLKSEPANVDVIRLMTARSAEMMACEASVHLATARAVTQLQRLPVRLRRRAASHAVRRIPRRLHYRQAAQTVILI